MHRSAVSRVVFAAVLALAAQAASAQSTAVAPAPISTAPGVGTMAPDFALPAATRYGLLRDPVRLSDLRGSTVVLAFFYRARTKG
jgi:hypothetical protein